MEYSIGVDVGGTWIRMAVVSELGTMVKLLKEPTGVINKPEELVERILGLYQRINAEQYLPRGMGVGVCGPVRRQDGYVYILPNIGIQDFSLRTMLQEKFSLPIFIGNDANLASLAEANLGAGTGYSIVQYLTISTGLGGGLVINHKLIEGSHGFAQEVSQMIIKEASAPHNKITNPGSWESSCSGTALQNLALEQGLSLSSISELFVLASEGDSIASAIRNRWVEDMAKGIANIINYIEPDIIILGGGIMQSNKYFMTDLQEEINRYIYPQLKGIIPIKIANFGQDSGIIGAALLAYYNG